MTINYICKGFDKDFYNFDSIVIPVKKNTTKELKQEVRCFGRQFIFGDFRHDFNEIIRGFPISAFKSDGITVVKSEKTGICYIFVLINSCDYVHIPYIMSSKINLEIYLDENYICCCEKIVKYINKLDVKNVLIHPAFNQVNFNTYIRPNMDIDFLAKTLKSNIDKFSKKNIYIFVGNLNSMEKSIENGLYRAVIELMEKGSITYEKCIQICLKNKMASSLSYTNKLVRIAEIETKYKAKSVAEQFCEDMNNDSWFFDEYINKYLGTDSDLAKNANISPSTVSTIKSHKYNGRSRNVVIALAIALDLTVDDRKRFINSAGFSYPITEHDRFIEQQLRRKRYTRVIDFNNDIVNEHPDFVIETRSSRGYKNKKSDK